MNTQHYDSVVREMLDVDPEYLEIGKKRQSLQDELTELRLAEQKLIDLKRAEAERIWNERPDWNVSFWIVQGGTVGFFATPKTGDVGYDLHAIRSIPGSEWDYTKQQMKVPLVEGWRLLTLPFEENEITVSWAEGVLECIEEQLKKRNHLIELAGKEDIITDRLKTLDRMIWNPRKGIREPFWEAMMGFQRVGVEYLLETGTRSILCDETGLGKTWQLVAAAELKRKEDEYLQVVCIVPAANIGSWVEELENLTGEDPVICGNGERVKNLALGRIMNGAPYILISHEVLGTYDSAETEELDLWGNKKKVTEHFWPNLFLAIPSIKMALIDEAHKIKNPEAFRTKAALKLVDLPFSITATASPILNRMNELWPLLHLTDPELFGSREKFERNYYWDGRSVTGVKALHEMLMSRFIRRRKKDVQKDLPPINRMDRIIHLEGEDKERYSEVVRGLYRQVKTFDPKDRGEGATTLHHILTTILRLKQVCAAAKIDYVADLATELVDQHENGNGKVLIFSQFKGSAYNIARKLGSQAACTVTKTPDDFHSMSPADRDKLFKEAKQDDRIQFVVTTGAAKFGHNLEFCSYVIFNDYFWSPEEHKQCEGRAYGRLADPHPIDSFYITAIDPSRKDNIEKWIEELLNVKKATIDEAIEGVAVSRDRENSLINELIKKIRIEAEKHE